MDTNALAALSGGKLQLLMDRFATANNRLTQRKTVLRILAVPPSPTCDVAALTCYREKEPVVRLPSPFDSLHDPAGPPPDVEVPSEAIQGCGPPTPVGMMGLLSAAGQSWTFAFLASNEASPFAARRFLRMAEEAGKATQTLRPSLTPIHCTSSSRNLWLTWLFGHLRGTPWVEARDGYEKIELPFGASCELSRRLLHGVDDSGKVYPGPAKSGDELNPQATAPKAPRKVSRRHAERNKWIYRQAIRKVPYQEIADRLQEIAPGRKWKPVKTKQGVWQLAFSFAKENGLEPPEARQNL